jgi:hypothetical protein
VIWYRHEGGDQRQGENKMRKYTVTFSGSLDVKGKDSDEAMKKARQKVYELRVNDPQLVHIESEDPDLQPCLPDDGSQCWFCGKPEVRATDDHGAQNKA